MRSPRRLGTATASARPRVGVDERLAPVPLVWSAIFRETGDAHVSDVLTRSVLTDPSLLRRHDDEHPSCADLVDAARRAAREWTGTDDRTDRSSRSGGGRLDVYECCERLERTLASEPPAVRDAMLLVYVAHRSCRRAADDLGTSVTEVRRRIDQGLAGLADVARGDRP